MAAGRLLSRNYLTLFISLAGKFNFVVTIVVPRQLTTAIPPRYVNALVFMMRVRLLTASSGCDGRDALANRDPNATRRRVITNNCTNREE